MNSKEYRELYTKHIVPAFPQIVRELFDGVASEEADARCDLWIHTLEGAELSDAAAIVADMAAGFIPRPKSWSDLALAIRQEDCERKSRIARVSRQRDERKARAGVGPEQNVEPWSMLERFRELTGKKSHE